MTQAQKRLFAGLKSAEQRRDFVQMIRDQQALMGRYDHWEASYRAKCLLEPDADSIPPRAG